MNYKNSEYRCTGCGAPYYPLSSNIPLCFACARKACQLFIKNLKKAGAGR